MLRYFTIYRLMPILMLCWASGLVAAPPNMAIQLSSQLIEVPKNKSQLLELPAKATKVSVGNPDIADILILQSNKLYVLGKKLGTTNVLVWNRKHQLIAVIDIEVTHNLNVLKSKLHQFLPDEEIKVHSSQDQLIMSGEVSSQAKMATAIQLASRFADIEKDDSNTEGSQASNVLNLMVVSGAHQVMLEVTVAEVQRSLIRKFDSNFHFMNNGSRWSYGTVSGGTSFPDALFGPDEVRIPVFDSGNGSLIGPVIDEILPNPAAIADKGLYASFMNSSTLFNVALDIAKTNGMAKVLAEPTLTTLSGEKAEFLSGGEYPVPVPLKDTIGIEYRPFGVGVKFLPLVLSSNRINLTVSLEVSELSNSNAMTISPNNTNSTFFVPSLTKRSATSTIELADGQTIGIAGLISEQLRDSVTKLPGLGDIPLLGQLFRSQEFQKGETELVILVTPRLAKPIDRKQLTLPTDGFVEPSDMEYYLLGKMSRLAEKTQLKESKQMEKKPVVPSSSKGGPEGQFGHSL